MLNIKHLAQKTLALAIIASSFIIYACDGNNQSTTTQLANPASVYCDEAGGTSLIIKDSDGNQSGYCEFSDGQQCDEWALLRGQCVPDIALEQPFEWCSRGMNSPVMSGQTSDMSLPAGLVKPMVTSGLASPEMPIKLLQASRWRCMDGGVWVCLIGANLPCDEQADLSTSPSDKMNEFCQSNPDADGIPAYVTGRASVYVWACEGQQAVAGKQFTEADEAGYLSNIWQQLKP